MNSNLLFLVLAMAFINLKATGLRAETLLTNHYGDDTRIETINNHAFFILKLNQEHISYGDKVELVFGLNHRIKAYNISGKDIHTFTNSNELVVLISAEDLRIFEKKKLKKVKIYKGSEVVIIRTNIDPKYLKNK
ncbi:MAG: hypothetical protein L3J29_09990 [Cyclobacteriaceae bacterium]|nr:hypothetical protein [Cyclobacteriaceae bacterium]